MRTYPLHRSVNDVRGVVQEQVAAMLRREVRVQCDVQQTACARSIVRENKPQPEPEPEPEPETQKSGTERNRAVALLRSAAASLYPIILSCATSFSCLALIVAKPGRPSFVSRASSRYASDSSATLCFRRALCVRRKTQRTQHHSSAGAAGVRVRV